MYANAPGEWYFDSSSPRPCPQNGVIDYEAIPHLAALFRPKLVVAGASAYSRLIDYERFKAVCCARFALCGPALTCCIDDTRFASPITLTCWLTSLTLPDSWLPRSSRQPLSTPIL